MVWPLADRTIRGGAQMVADSGILAGHTATSHHTILNLVENSHPEVSWVRGVRYVDDGRFISSAGATSGVDATLFTLQQRKLATCASFFLPYLHPGMTVLDCGGGPGALTLEIARRVAPGQVVGIDVDPSQCAQAQALAAAQGGREHPVRASRRVCAAVPRCHLRRRVLTCTHQPSRGADARLC